MACEIVYLNRGGEVPSEGPYVLIEYDPDGFFYGTGRGPDDEIYVSASEDEKNFQRALAAACRWADERKIPTVYVQMIVDGWIETGDDRTLSLLTPKGEITLDGRERRLLAALVLMVRQYLDHHDNGMVDTLSMSAGEHAINVLTEYGLMEVVSDATPGQSRFARWTESGNEFWEAT